MVAKKKVCWVDAPADDALRHTIEETASSEKKRAAMLKDIHLVEAALQADKIVISMDDTVRHCLHDIAFSIGVLKHIIWVNPYTGEDNAIGWLQDGAKPEKERLLGALKA